MCRNKGVNSWKVLLCVLTFGLYYTTVDGCDLTSVMSCTSILGRSANVTVMGEGLSAIPTVEQLTELCSSLGEFKECYLPKAAACENDVIFSMTFGTVEKTIDYLCQEGFNDILEYASCWNQTEVTVDTTNCHVLQNEMISALQARSTQLNSTQMRDNWCMILDNTTSCMGEAVERRCGSAPACIMRTMMTRALEGLSGLMKCPAPESCVVRADVSSVPSTDTHPNAPDIGDNTTNSGSNKPSNNSNQQTQNPDLNTADNSAVSYRNSVVLWLCFVVYLATLLVNLTV